jgi:hypothetical protein
MGLCYNLIGVSVLLLLLRYCCLSLLLLLKGERQGLDDSIEVERRIRK